MQIAVLFVRPRGWHLLEKHMHVDGQPVPAAIFDFALYFFHNAKELLKRNTGVQQIPCSVFGSSSYCSSLHPKPVLCLVCLAMPL